MPVSAKLLGTAGINHDGDWLEFPASKTTAFLYYLAYQRIWVGRDDLVYLFWPDLIEERARRNLRRLLFDIKNLPYTGELEIEPTRVRWPIETDVEAFTQVLTGNHRKQTLDLYRGELLRGFKLPREPEFEFWLTTERQALHRVWREVIFSTAEDLAGAGRHQEASELLERLIKADPADEEALQSHLRALHLGGRRGKALAAFEHFRSTLKVELGAEPSTATLKLVGEIQQESPLGTPTQTTSPTTPQDPATGSGGRPSLPVPSTRFVGRENEITYLSELLADPSCRLVTLMGPGGIGKTRLAIEVARAQLGCFSSGVIFVPFTDVTSAEFMIYAIADALGFGFSGNADPKQQLLAHLRDKEMLLVLDSFEHLLEGTGLVMEMLSATPGIKVLVTSREILNLQAERIFELGGLRVPGEHSEATLESDAVSLFVQRASNRRPDLQLDQSSAQAIARICRLVGGMPLAIELAASWVHVLTPQDIAVEVEQGIGFLQAAKRDLPERHRSVRAVFDRSWELLTEEEQRVVRKLAVFSGGFRREAAAEIAGAGLSVVAGLVDTSFLSTTPSGRYEQHPLVRHYGREKLAEDPWEQAQTEERHGLHFLHLLQRLERKLSQRDLRRTVAEELENIKAAWHWAITKGRIEELKKSAEPLYIFFGMSRHPGGHFEGLEILTQALAALDESNPHHRAALGYVLVEQAEHLVWLARHEQARQQAQRALSLLEPLGETRGLLLGTWVLAHVAAHGGDLDGAEVLYEQCLTMAREEPLPHYRGAMQLGLLKLRAPRLTFAQVRQRFVDLEADFKKAEEAEEPLITLYLIHGIYLLDHGKLQESRRVLGEGLHLAREFGANFYLPGILSTSAKVASRLGDHRQAQHQLRNVLALVREQGLRIFEPEILNALGKVLTAQGEYRDARIHLEEGLVVAWRSQNVPAALHLVVSLAETRVAAEPHDSAASWLAFVLHHPSAPSQARKEAQELLDSIQDQASPVEYLESRNRASDLTLEDIVDELSPQH